MLLRSCLSVVICFIKVSTFANGNSGGRFSRNENLEQVVENSDFPRKDDILRYLNSILQVMKFARKNKNEIEINFAIGLSAVYDNLKNVLIKKKYKLPEKLKININVILKYNSELLKYYKLMVKRDKYENDDKNSKILVSTLFLNRTLGVRGIEAFDPKKNIKVSRVHVDYVFPNWVEYEYKVRHNIRKPDPKKSDLCLLSLARNKMNRSKCKLKRSCYDMLQNGTDFGYPLTHRLLWILQAKRGRGCRLFSEDRDNNIIDKFCERIFLEAHYIALNGYKLLDLLLEQMALCPLAGYADTLRRSWLSEALRYQTTFGCFNLSLHAPPVIPKNNEQPWSIYSNYLKMLQGTCNMHFTAVAAGALAAALRFILETNY